MNESNTKKPVVLQCEGVSKAYRDGGIDVQVFKDINLSVREGEQIAIVGPSGVGKSTLLHVLGGLDSVTEGTVSLLGENVYQMSEKKRCRLRNKQLGFVYQFHHLLPEFTALENVMMPLLIGRVDINTASGRAEACLKAVGLTKRISHKPTQLSGGERQRVAIARALVSRPTCILADEPTGNLDNKTADMIFELFLSLNEEYNTAFVIVTHDMNLALKAQRVLALSAQSLDTYSFDVEV